MHVLLFPAMSSARNCGVSQSSRIIGLSGILWPRSWAVVADADGKAELRRWISADLKPFSYSTLCRFWKIVRTTQSHLGDRNDSPPSLIGHVVMKKINESTWSPNQRTPAFAVARSGEFVTCMNHAAHAWLVTQHEVKSRHEDMKPDATTNLQSALLHRSKAQAGIAQLFQDPCSPFRRVGAFLAGGDPWWRRLNRSRRNSQFTKRLVDLVPQRTFSPSEVLLSWMTMPDQNDSSLHSRIGGNEAIAFFC
jgi:hypothetical protein